MADNPNDVEAIVVAWLSQLRRTAVTRAAGDELPFTLVRHVAGGEKLGEGTADPVVSVHTLCDRSLGEAAAAVEAAATHDHMRKLGRTFDWTITLPDDTEVSVDYVIVDESPIWEFYSDQILRKVGRYQIGVTYVDPPDGS